MKYLYADLVRCLELLPIISVLVVVMVLLYFEIRDHRFKREGSTLASINNGIACRKEAYTYHARFDTSLKICKIRNDVYNIYLVTGEAPEGVYTRTDQYGEYFVLHGKNAAVIEDTIDRMYS